MATLEWATELRRVKKEISELRQRLDALQDRKKELEALLDARHTAEGPVRELMNEECTLNPCAGPIAAAWQDDSTERIPTCGKVPPPTLESIIETAITDGMDTIELEYVPEGLEVTYVSGNHGVGHVIADRSSVKRIVDDLISQAQLEDKSRGVLKRSHGGNSYDIRVTERQSFGESEFRLRLKKSGRHA